MLMPTEHTVDEEAIRQRIGELAQAVRAMDLELLIPFYASEVVSFDVQASITGAEAKRRSWELASSVLNPPYGYEIRDLKIRVNGKIAVAHGYARLSGSNSRGVWVRATLVFEKVDGKWIIVHDHASVPLDLKSGQPLLDLNP